MTVHLGFSCSQHDPSVAIVDDEGRVTFAEANERPLKTKRGWHAPPDAFGVVDPLLSRCAGAASMDANVSWSGRALASVPTLRWITRQIAHGLRHDPNEGRRWRAWMLRHALYRAPHSVADLLLNLEMRLVEQPRSPRLTGKRGWDHHLCHATTACFSSPFDDATCVVVDGMGEGSSTSVFRFRDDRLERIDRPSMANLSSLGHIYSQVCFAAGFDPAAGEEWKLMGLAPYGRLDEDLYERLSPLVRIERGRLGGSGKVRSVLDGLMGSRRHDPMANADLAHTAQRLFEEAIHAFLVHVHAEWGGGNLVLTGGCALNSSANGKVLSSTPFQSLHVPMAPGDDGNAVGAAILGWQAANKGKRFPRFASPYLGSEMSGVTLKRLRSLGSMPSMEVDDEAELAEITASALAGGSIVGVARGKAEFGPRALGNRSILANPGSAAMRDRINERVKFRETFRPLAPSVLHERGHSYFEAYQDSPYMDRTLRWTPGSGNEAVRHVDQTGRPQSVTRERNSFLHATLSAFERRTGSAVVLNTSFNVMGRPIVHDVEDAIGVFMTSDIDMLIVNNAVFGKNRPG